MLTRSAQQFLFGISCNQLRLQSSESSTRLDIQNDSLTWLAVDAECWSGAQLGLSPRASYMWLLHVSWASHSMKDELWEEKAQEQVFQEAGSEAAGPAKDYAWNFPSITSSMFYWSESHGAFPESRRWRKRFHLLIENDRVTLHKSNVVGWEMSLQWSLESTIYHIGIIIIPGQKLVSSLIRRGPGGMQKKSMCGPCL